MSRRIPIHFAAAFSVAAVLVALAVVVVDARPAQATPDRTTVCTVCHSGTPSGNVAAVPSTTTPAAGAAYTVAINVNLATSGKTGYHIANSDAGGTTGTWTNVFAGGPNAPSGQTSWTANMTAPATAGTYYYKVFGVKGYSGSASTATYSITVAASPPPGDTTAPVTIAGATNGAWYKAAVNVTLSATDASDVDHIAYTLDGTTGTITGASGQVPIAGDGPHTLTYQAVDKATPANTESLKSLTVNIDGVSPVAAVLANATVKKGAKATIRYQVVDTPATGTAVTTIKIKNKAGKVVKTLKSTATVGAARSARFICKLTPGVYKVTARAKDRAGNVSAVSAAKRLTVK